MVNSCMAWHWLQGHGSKVKVRIKRMHKHVFMPYLHNRWSYYLQIHVIPHIYGIPVKLNHTWTPMVNSWHDIDCKVMGQRSRSGSSECANMFSCHISITVGHTDVTCTRMCHYTISYKRWYLFMSTRDDLVNMYVYISMRIICWQCYKL